MAGLMAVLMKEIAIMNAEANPDATSDDNNDVKSPDYPKIKVNKTSTYSCDNLDVFNEFDDFSNVSLKMQKLNFSKQSRFVVFLRHPRKMFPIPVKKYNMKDGR